MQKHPTLLLVAVWKEVLEMDLKNPSPFECL